MLNVSEPIRTLYTSRNFDRAPLYTHFQPGRAYATPP